MLENLRRKSLVKTYIDPTHLVRFEQGHAIYLDLFSFAQHKQRLSKENQEKSFPSTFDGAKGFRLISHALGKVQFNMIYCPSGTFIMGHIAQDENPPREETIERPFLLGETEITQELYKKVIGKNPSEFKNKPQNPVNNLSWYDTILFCNKLSELQGLDECYILTDTSTIDEDGKDQKRIMSAKVTCDFNKNGYRLPTEKEWEYAAKAGTQNLWAGTNKATELGGYAWFGGNSSTHPVKTKNPNGWGFYDMSGNVAEWCWDKYNPKGDASTSRVSRGGSCWYDNTWYLRSAYRHAYSPSDRIGKLGFRVCRSIVN